MTEAKIKSGIFFGWWTVFVTGIFSGLVLGFYMYGISALFKPIALELGLSRAAASGATGIGFMLGSLLSPVTGWLVDKFGPKLSILAGLILSIVGLVLMYFVVTGWQYYLVWGVIFGIGGFWGFTIAVDKSLSDWFVKKIGLAMGAKFAIIGLTGAVSVPIISWLISTIGWRITCLIWAGILVLGIPLILLFVKNRRPEHYGIRPDGDRIATKPVREAGSYYETGSTSENATSGSDSIRERGTTNASRMSTTTSRITVTPIRSSVMGPLARVSATIPMVVDGERAAITRPNRSATAAMNPTSPPRRNVT